MKIFITGIAGFLGSHLAKRLKNLGHEVFGNDNLILGELEIKMIVVITIKW